MGKVLPHTTIGTGADGAIEINLVSSASPKRSMRLHQQ